MREQLPPPEFDDQRYERPTANWICGRSAEGEPCRVGPDRRGTCRASFECRPLLERKEGEEKGIFICTRPAEYGGPCETGPLPSGSCSRLVPKCRPIRSLRAKRGLWTIGTLALLSSGLLILLSGPQRQAFINPGPISVQHSGANFAKMAQERLGLPTPAGRCAACHTQADESPDRWMDATLASRPGPFEFHKLTDSEISGLTRIDQACLRCHEGHAFHQATVAKDHSCLVCHDEHRGGSGLTLANADACASCHANPIVMRDAAEKGRQLPRDAFLNPQAGSVALFQSERPENGYTQIINTFADHPEFRFRAAQLRDGNSLKFNHERHFQDDVLTNGRKLECASCHQPDASGIYYQRVSFETNCRSCHQLQVDPEFPGLTVPHGSVEAARSFLASLWVHYAEVAKRDQGMTRDADVEEFVLRQRQRLRDQKFAGLDLESAVFYSQRDGAPVASVGGLAQSGRPTFYGCASCHEVKPGASGVPVVTQPVMPDRWLALGSFHHSKHVTVACLTCHGEVTHSRATSDILLPQKAICATCHQPKSGAPDTCFTCHIYHNRPPLTPASTTALRPLSN